jgi:hypothetical protein
VTDQPNLFDPPPRTLARLTDPPTSHEAAIDQHGVRVTHRMRLLAAIAAAGPLGLTYAEAGERTGIGSIEPARRISDLLHAGLVTPRLDGDGCEVTRRLPSGRQGRVYVAVREHERNAS